MNRDQLPRLQPAAGLAVGEAVSPPLLDAVRTALSGAAPQEIDMAAGESVQRLTIVPLSASGQANIYGRDVTDLHHTADSLAVAEALADTRPLQPAEDVRSGLAARHARSPAV